MAAVREQMDMKLAQLGIEGKTIEDYFSQPTIEEAVKWDKDLKKEIIYWGQYDLGVTEIKKDYAKNHADAIFEELNIISNLYYIDKEIVEGKENYYLYDAKEDIVYKVPKTRIGMRVVHSIVELDNGREKTETEEVIKADSTTVTVSGLSYYEPNLSGYVLDKTKIVYYEVREQGDTSTEQLGTIEVSAREYITGGKKNEIQKDGKTYQFYDYAKQRWANILVENNNMKSYWVWIPRYSYKEGDVSDIKFIDLNSTPEEGYIVHSDFSDGKKGIWVSKYEPILTANTVVSDFPYYIPDLTGFVPENTYIEVYDKDKKEFKETRLKDISNLTEFAKKNNWFDYNNQVWANIRVYEPESKTESWWVWIPRYAYSITGNTTSVEFIDLQNRPLDGNPLPSNYVVHSAFVENNKKGIWVSKYEPVQKIGEVGATNLVNKPDMKGYNVDNTYVESYDENTKTFKEQSLRSVLGSSAVINNTTKVLEKSDIDLSKIQGTWYSYDKQIWANIKVKTDGVESWWVWIPRYAYNITGIETSLIWLGEDDKPLDGSELPSNYIPHSAFEDGKAGIWASKYEPVNK